MFDQLEFKKVMNVPMAVIIASFILILITTNVTDSNGLSALVGGYSGLLAGVLFVIVLNMIFNQTNSYLDMFPLLMICIIVSLLLVYLILYFDRISKGEVSSYYSSFSILSTIFLMTQMIIVFNAIYSSEPKTKMFSDTTFSLLGLFSVVNVLIVITIGIVLHFYSTQG